MVDRRAAKALVEAARAIDRQLGLVDIATEAHRLGFAPKDFNGPDGPSAMVAIATQMLGRRILFCRHEPVQWRGAVDRALNLITR